MVWRLVTDNCFQPKQFQREWYQLADDNDNALLEVWFSPYDHVWHLDVIGEVVDTPYFVNQQDAIDWAESWYRLNIGEEE